MKKNFIIKMLDGGIRDISTDTWCEHRGCSTCGYGGWHVGEMEIHLKDSVLRVELGTMYNFDLPSEQDLIHWFDDNTEKIKNMTEEEFIEFFTKDNEVFEFCDKVKFFIVTKKEI